MTTVSGTPFERYGLEAGDKYMAARSNEFGYANYEIQAAN